LRLTNRPAGAKCAADLLNERNELVWRLGSLGRSVKPETVRAIVPRSSTTAIQTARRWMILLSSTNSTRTPSAAFAGSQPLALQQHAFHVSGFPDFLPGIQAADISTQGAPSGTLLVACSCCPTACPMHRVHSSRDFSPPLTALAEHFQVGAPLTALADHTFSEAK